MVEKNLLNIFIREAFWRVITTLEKPTNLAMKKENESKISHGRTDNSSLLSTG